jgi:hypothetical protein
MALNGKGPVGDCRSVVGGQSGTTVGSRGARGCRDLVGGSRGAED